VFNQRWGTSIHDSKGRQIRRRHAELRSVMPPQQRRNYPHRFQQPPTHAQKPNLQREPELQLRSPALFDHSALSARELKEGRDGAAISKLLNA
jgi:hypothetical protein